MWNNPDWYNHEAKANQYEPKWDKLVDFSPERNPSASKILTSVVGEAPVRVIRVWQVRGLGVLVAQVAGSSDETGKLQFDGLSIFTKEEVGFAPQL